jgi:putative transposase
MGYPHHIIQRGHNRQVVFASDADYQYYLDNLCEWKEKPGCKVYAYCLMTHHVHLIVVDPGEDGGNLARLMKQQAGKQDTGIKCVHKRGNVSVGRLFHRSVPSNILNQIC